MPATVHIYVPFREEFIRSVLDRHFPDREVIVWSETDAFVDGIGEVEFLFSLHPPRDQWRRAGHLKMIHCMGAGVDDLLPAEGLPKHVVIANNRGLSAEPMAEFALALILGLIKKLPVYLEGQRTRHWRRTIPGKVAGQTLGILGLGEIGRALADRAHALGMHVIGTQRTPKAHPSVERIYGSDETEAVLAASDVLVILLPFTGATRNLLNRERLSCMKPGAYLVNLARGGIVDEEALVDMLKAKKLAGAAFDVFSQEPLPEDSPLWDTPNLWITPHIAGGFPEMFDLAVAEFAENVTRIERGESPIHVVNREQGY